MTKGERQSYPTPPRWDLPANNLWTIHRPPSLSVAILPRSPTEMRHLSEIRKTSNSSMMMVKGRIIKMGRIRTISNKMDIKAMGRRKREGRITTTDRMAMITTMRISMGMSRNILKWLRLHPYNL